MTSLPETRDDVDLASSGHVTTERLAPRCELVIPTNAEFRLALSQANGAETLKRLRSGVAALEAIAEKCKAAHSELVRLAIYRLEVERKLGSELARTVRRGRPKKRSSEE